MKKIGIVTMQGLINYGNRLQNYAVQQVIANVGATAITLKNTSTLNSKNKFILRVIKNCIVKTKLLFSKKNIREKKFYEFNKLINMNLFDITPYSKISRKFDYFIVGSDQVWNPNICGLRDVELLTFAKPSQKIAFSASFGIAKLPDNLIDYAKKNLQTFKVISVRENIGKKIIEDITGRKDVEVLLDPTMLLSTSEWDKVAKKPQQLDNLKSNKYILNYFLGESLEEWNAEINRIAKENNCEIINILDINDPFYQTGPSEFLYLEKNAFIICTDSFHSSVFAILYDRPFILFDRRDKLVDMSSRMDTLLLKFKLEDRRYNGKITEKLLTCNYKKTKKILEIEKKKSINFLKKGLEIEK